LSTTLWPSFANNDTLYVIQYFLDKMSISFKTYISDHTFILFSGLFARALEGVNVKELITNIGSAAGSAPAAGGAAPAAGGAAEEKKGK
jgi:large subunit ribosomal protein LP1